MKKLLLFILIIFIVSCSSLHIKAENIVPPSFDFQKTYLLRQVPFVFSTYYNVWKYFPVNFLEFTNIKEIRDAKLFTARKKIALTGNHFTIIDRKNEKKYILKQEFLDSKADTTDILTYSIWQGDNIIGSINQIYNNDILNFEFIYKNKVININGEIKKIGSNIHGFYFKIKKKDVILGNIVKKYAYFKNEYEILINREYNIIEDPVFICFGIFVDQVLKENGYHYK